MKRPVCTCNSRALNWCAVHPEREGLRPTAEDPRNGLSGSPSISKSESREGGEGDAEIHAERPISSHGSAIPVYDDQELSNPDYVRFDFPDPRIRPLRSPDSEDAPLGWEPETAFDLQREA